MNHNPRRARRHPTLAATRRSMDQDEHPACYLRDAWAPCGGHRRRLAIHARLLRCTTGGPRPHAGGLHTRVLSGQRRQRTAHWPAWHRRSAPGRLRPQHRGVAWHRPRATMVAGSHGERPGRRRLRPDRRQRERAHLAEPRRQIHGLVACGLGGRRRPGSAGRGAVAGWHGFVAGRLRGNGRRVSRHRPARSCEAAGLGRGSG